MKNLLLELMYSPTTSSLRASVVAGSEEGETEDLNVGGNAEQESPKGSTSSKEYFVLDDMTGEVIRACPRLLMKKTKITHAWALSIHKFQGSEAEVKQVQQTTIQIQFLF